MHSCLISSPLWNDSSLLFRHSLCLHWYKFILLIIQSTAKVRLVACGIAATNQPTLDCSWPVVIVTWSSCITDVNHNCTLVVDENCLMRWHPLSSEVTSTAHWCIAVVCSGHYSTTTSATEWSGWRRTTCRRTSRRRWHCSSTSVSTWMNAANVSRRSAVARHQCQPPGSSWRNGFVLTEQLWCISATERYRSHLLCWVQGRRKVVGSEEARRSEAQRVEWPRWGWGSWGWGTASPLPAN